MFKCCPILSSPLLLWPLLQNSLGPSQIQQLRRQCLIQQQLSKVWSSTQVVKGRQSFKLSPQPQGAQVWVVAPPCCCCLGRRGLSLLIRPKQGCVLWSHLPTAAGTSFLSQPGPCLFCHVESGLLVLCYETRQFCSA